MKKHGLVLMVSAAVAVSLMGGWLAVAPRLDKWAAFKAQSRLLDSIASADGTMTLRPVEEHLDFYDDTFGAEEDQYPPNPSLVSQPDDANTDPSHPSLMIGMGILSIEKIDLELPVVRGVSKRKLKIALGWTPQTAEIGAVGNAVIAGHRSYTYGQYFNRLDELEAGDIITYQSKDGAPIPFEVYDISTVTPGDQGVFAQADDIAEITLYTCTPVKVASHRLIIRAKRID